MPERLPGVGVVLENPNDTSRLRERVVSVPLSTLDPIAAIEEGFWSGQWGTSEGAIVPKTVPAPWVEDVARLRTPNPKWPLHLLKIPRALGENALRVSQRAGQASPIPKAFTELVPGLWGAYQAVRNDAPGQLCVTDDLSRETVWGGSPRKVGLHIDAWFHAHRPVSYLIGNLGPGPRISLIVPEVTRYALALQAGGRVPALHNLQRASVELMRSSSRDERIHNLAQRAVGFVLNPPDDEYMEAVVGVPVSEMLHDGSTAFNPPSTEHSLSVMISVDMERSDFSQFESLV